MSAAMVPTITTTTKGSSTTDSAILSAVEQGHDTDLVLVDLVRVDDEKPGKSIPDGIDMEEAEAPAQSSSREEEAREFGAGGPESAYSNVDQEQGTVVADVNGAFPSIDDKEDHSGGPIYGVQSFEGGSGNA